MNINKSSFADVVARCEQRIAKMRQSDPFVPRRPEHGRCVDSTPIEDVFERTSCEEKAFRRTNADNVDSYFSQRDYELVDDDLDINPNSYLYHSYDADDVPLSEELIKKTIGYESVPTEYYPQTHFDKTSEGILNFINSKDFLFEQLGKGCNSRRLGGFYKISSKALRNGMPARKVLDLFGKSALKLGNGKISRSESLYDFLVNNPAQRSVAVVKNVEGKEILDKIAMERFPKFKELFKDSKIAEDMLDLCRVKDESGALMVDNQLSYIASLLKTRANAKTAASVPSPLNRNERALLRRLNDNSELSKDCCDVVIEMLEDGEKVKDILKVLQGKS